MLKYTKISLFLAILLLPAFSVAAFAESIQGKVAAISPTALDITVFDAQGRPYPNTLHLKIDRATKYSGVSSSSVIRKRDMIRVDVRQEKTGTWRADSVTKLYATTTVQQAPAQPSSSLMDALKSPTGQKVIRNGITGAITGAVASGATGGKAGKGALIGAGVGVAGGLLADMFSGQNSQSQNSNASVSTEDNTRR